MRRSLRDLMVTIQPERAPSGWTHHVSAFGRLPRLATIFPNATCVTALIARVMHHAVIAIEGDSYRCKKPKSTRLGGRTG